ncbi:MAG: hypothetical protein FWC72_05830, partial [Oscillospiraceae bacterium]|nr:hypothetical protein [Oscillospiraceae bacterium]
MNDKIFAEIARVTGYIAENSADARELPCKATVVNCLETLRYILFPGHFVSEQMKHTGRKARVEALLKALSLDLICQIRFANSHSQGCEVQQGESALRDAEALTADFLAKIPKIKEYLTSDIEALYQG